MDQVGSNEGFTAGRPGTSFGPQPSGGSTIETIKETVADKLHSAANILQEKAGQHQENAVACYAGQAAGWLDDAAQYIREVDSQKVKTDIQHQVRSNPGRTLLIAGAAGLLIGMLLRR